MGTEYLAVERLFAPSDRDRVSFQFTIGGTVYWIDSPVRPPDVTVSNLHPGGVIFSHYHKDHCPQKPTELPEVWISDESKVLLRHIGVELDHFDKEHRKLEPLVNVYIDGLGNVLPFSVSHSSIDSLGFFITTPRGDTILYTGDIRSGYRTDRAIDLIKQLVGKQRVTLLIGDATGVGKEHLSIEQHLDKLKSALRLAKEYGVPTSICIKAGDYGNIALWLANNVFDSCELYLAPKVKQVLEELNWLSFLDRRFNYKPPEFAELKDRIRDNRYSNDTQKVVIYDDSWKNPLKQERVMHVLVNASRRDIPYSHELNIALVPVGLSGHSGQAFIDMMRVANPVYYTYLHGPKNDHSEYEKSNLVLGRKGKLLKL